MYWLENLPEDVAAVARNCDAPICTVRVKIFPTERTIWYPGEPVCRCYRKAAVKKWLGLENGSAPLWVRRQLNISKKPKYPEHYYTYEMLIYKGCIGGRTKGIDPNRPEEDQVASFFKRREKYKNQGE